VPNPCHCPGPSRLPAFDQTWREYIYFVASEPCQLEGVASSFKYEVCEDGSPRRINRAVWSLIDDGASLIVLKILVSPENNLISFSQPSKWVMRSSQMFKEEAR